MPTALLFCSYFLLNPTLRVKIFIMKRYHSLSLIFILAIALVLIPSLKLICDDEESVPGTLFSYFDIFSSCELLACIFIASWIFLFHQSDTIVPAPIISYLERQEKSPPA